jgi:Ni/Co efflux regulator RcnB
MRVNPVPASMLAILLAALLAAAPAQAKSGHGEGHGNQHEQSGDDDGPGHGKGHKAKDSLDDRTDPRVRGDDVGKGTRMGRKDLAPGAYFNDRHRETVRTYYASHEGKGCPPGLAKKNNGCLPPGQGAKWRIGERLPPTVVVQVVPQPVLVRLPPVPPGYRYVQVAGDVLLVAIGSQMVVDGINGLLR